MTGRALITGAGLLGAAVAQRLRGAGWEVLVVDRDADRLKMLGEGIHREWCPIENPGRLISTAERWRPEALVHTAALIGDAASDPAGPSVNVGGTRNVVAAAAGLGACLLHVSTLAVYGASLSCGPSEDAPRRPLSAYGKTKAAAERLVLGAVAHRLLSAWVLRPAGLYGPGGAALGGRRASALHALVRRLAKGGQTDLPKTLVPRQEYVHVSDAARALELVLTTRPRPGTVMNVGSGCLVDGAELAHLLSRFTPGRIEVPPGPFYGVLAPLDSRRAEELLGFRATIGLEAGLADLVRCCGQAATTGLEPAPTGGGHRSA